MEGKGIETIDEQWDVFSPVTIDDSTESYQFNSLKPLGSNLLGNAFGQQSPIEFFITDSQRYINLSKSYIQLAVNLQYPTAGSSPYNAGTLPANYPPGTPIAMEFDAARLFQRIELIYGNSNLESTSVYHDRTCLVRDLLTIDGTYAANRNANSATITDMFILDDPGTNCQTTTYSQQISFTGLAAPTTPAGYGTWGTNSVLNNGWGSLTGGNTSGWGVYGNGGGLLLNATGTSQYFINQGNIVMNPLFNSGFAKRASLTDNGKVAMLRIPLSRFLSFAEINRVLYGQNCMIRLYPQSSSKLIYHSYVDSNGVVIPDGQLTVQSLDMMLAIVKPSISVQAKISEQLIANTSQELVWDFADTYSYQLPITTGASTITQIVTSISERPKYVIFTFQPTSYSNSQLYPTASSFQPYIGTAPAPGLVNAPAQSVVPNSGVVSKQTPFGSTYIQLGSKYYPQFYYWSVPGDNARIYQTYLDIMNRANDPSAGLTPCLGYNDMFNDGSACIANGVPAGNGGFFLLCFDLRHIEMDATSVGQPQQLIFTANMNSAITSATTLYCTVITERQAQVQASNRSIVVTRK